MAVYNAMAYDLNLNDHEGPIVFMDIGTRATDVIVAEHRGVEAPLRLGPCLLLVARP